MKRRKSEFKTEVQIERYTRPDNTVIHYVYDMTDYDLVNELSGYEFKKDTIRAIRQSKEYIWRGSQLNTTEEDY